MQIVNYGPLVRPRRRNDRLGIQLLMILAIVGIYMLCTFSWHIGWNSGMEMEESYINSASSGASRHLTALNCSPKLTGQFAIEIFTLDQRRSGAVLVYIAVALYMFAALAIVCDEYFVSSLQNISEALNVTPDVAGATFMAAGNSAPELFTVIIGIYITESDVGVSTIIGSEIFNILCIVALCGLFSGVVIHLSWWPICRDTVYYMFSIICLIVVIYDKMVTWYEALVLLLMYIGYIIIMYFNSDLEHFFTNFCRPEKQMEKVPLISDERRSTQTSIDMRSYYEKDTSESGKCKTDRGEDSDEDGYGSERTTFSRSGSRANLNEIEEEDEYESPFTLPDGYLSRLYWFLMLPVQAALFVTVPDCRRSGCWKRLYMMTFFMSIIWIALFSYVMVWMVVLIGETFSIPDTIMGMTFLAVGTSVPDALSALFVARDGYGNMAVSNAVGSNVFDVLLGMPFPWFLKTMMDDDVVHIQSSGLVVSILILLGSVLVFLLALKICNWKLTMRLSLFLFFLYLSVITISCLYELNIFTEINLPQC